MKRLVDSQKDFGVNRLGPRRQDEQWQAQEETGFDAGQFTIDWEHQEATYPEGHTSISWTPAVDKRSNEVSKSKFSIRDCRFGVSRELCIRSTKQDPRRTATVRAKEHYEALQAARERQKTEAFTEEYAMRAGIEGTIFPGVRGLAYDAPALSARRRRISSISSPLRPSTSCALVTGSRVFRSPRPVSRPL